MSIIDLHFLDLWVSLDRNRRVFHTSQSFFEKYGFDEALPIKTMFNE